jgi:hypothetical protein
LPLGQRIAQWGPEGRRRIRDLRGEAIASAGDGGFEMLARRRAIVTRLPGRRNY